jgi:hypothetical protein
MLEIVKFFGKILIIVTSLIVALSAGCARETDRVMQYVQYEQPISVRSSQNATIRWVVGQEHTTTREPIVPYNVGIVGAALAMAIDTEMRKSHPDSFVYGYGKEQQSIFMQSLQETLVSHKTFKTVKLTTERTALHKNDVLITVFFKIARVDGSRVLLDVELSIKDKKHQPFKRTYLVEGDVDGGLVANQTDASKKLLAKVIMGIQQWHGAKQSHK